MAPSRKFSGPCLYAEGIDDSVQAEGDFAEDCWFNAELNFFLSPNADATSYKTEDAVLQFLIQMNCPELAELAVSKEVAFFTRIVVNRTKFRTAVQLQKVSEGPWGDDSGVLIGNIEARIPVSPLFGSFDIELFLAATQNSVWKHRDSDGDQMDIALFPGRVCAYCRMPERYEVSRTQTQVPLMSIFLLKAIPDDSIEPDVVSCTASEESEKLEICVSQSSYSQLALAAKNMPEVFKDRIVMPALSSVLAQVYTPSDDSSSMTNSASLFEDRHWFKVIDAALSKIGYQVRDRSVEDAFSDAQLLLDRPAKRVMGETNE